ncbi:bifunctional protein-serine/threonine kinase/phosphatase [Roseateles koreensis]|uniref:Protein kinase n=1 Tax=Roseateles koreensis TaxID=2987526 RepID=A0ABT5KU13_9BURK|nr:bifunctional protein-serine/threonine kinase/phosphatase [Roseateles koreensis]MDC8786404.1 protein kinase [Roseateles koreensis]
MSGGLRVTLGQHSQAGCKPVNQDFHGAVLPTGERLRTKGIALALADGISSSSVSQIASAAAVRGFLEDYYCTSEAWSVRRAAQCVLEASNSWLHAQTQRSDARFDKDRGYVCTFSALIFKGREAHLLHVGDTRVYRLHAQALEQLTEDHRVRISSVQSYLGRALGTGPGVEIDYRSWTTEVGELYLLATDGVYEHIDAAAVHAALALAPGHSNEAGNFDALDAAAAALVATALARGSQDNLTAQLVRIDALPPIDAALLHTQREGLRIPPALHPRDRFEGYTIVRELHCSSRSHVHLALDTDSGRQVVLKTPSVDLRDNPAYLDSFLLEEWIARRIDSEFVVKPCPAERPREHLFVALEYVQGQTLAQWMIDHPAPDLDAVRRIIEQVAQGLQAFHRKEMLHQDLRPENLMIDRNGTVKIIDLASTHVAGLTEGTHQAQARALLGSLQYTAPEYFVGGVGTPQSELFSLAVIAYQMLTGQLPYGLQIPRLRKPGDLQGLRYISARERRLDLPPWLDAVLRRALQPQPHKRQEALSEFMHDLRTPGAQYLGLRAPPLIERNPVAFWQGLSLLLTVAVVVLAVVASQWGHRP